MSETRSRAIFHVLLLTSFLATLLGSAAFPIPARAATLVVTSAADSGAGSLRQAVLDAASGDTIIFDNSLNGQVINLSSEIDINYKDLTITGPGAANLTLNGVNPPVRIFGIQSATVIISGLTIANGHTDTAYDGGGINNSGGSLTVNNVIFTNNIAGRGGAIYNFGGSLTVNNVIFTNNQAAGSGGAIYQNQGSLTITNSTFNGGTAYDGAGIMATNLSLMVTNCTFSSNTASGYGGGILWVSGDTSTNTLTVLNSTFSSNHAARGSGINRVSIALGAIDMIANSTFSANDTTGLGGGLFSADGTLLLTNNTFSANSASSGGGIYSDSGSLSLINNTFSANSASSGGGIYSQSSLSLINNILANSTAGNDCINAGGFGTVSHNLIETGNCPFTTNLDPVLSALVDHGGPTQTFALLPGSPAIDSGDNATCAAAPVNNLDQRGVTRPLDGDGNGSAICDLGSFEAEYLEPTVTTITADTPDPSVVGQSVSVSVSVAGTSGTPSGTVEITGANSNCTITLASGSGSCAVGFASPGSKTLTATYNGNAAYSGSQDTEGHTVNPANTTTTITSASPDPSAPGQSVTVSYTVAVAAPGSGVPTGNVTVSDGVDSCTATVAAGSCNISLTSSGSRSLTATYAGDANFNGSSDSEGHTVDGSPPQVVSITRAGANPSNAESVNFLVTFNEPVTGVDVADFSLTTGGTLSGASVSGLSGTGTAYTVSVNTGIGSGSLRLDVSNTATIEDLVGNDFVGPYTSGESYTIDKAVPVIISSERLDPNPSNAESVDFLVTFSEPVTGVDIADFSLTTGGTLSGASVSGLSGTGTAYTVSVNTGSGSGSLRLDVSNTATIEDLVGNDFVGPYTSGESYTIDKSAPVVVSSERLDPNPTNAASVDFLVTFSEPVTGVDIADFSLTTGGTLSGASVSGLSGTGTAYTVSVNTGSGSGSLRLDVSNTATIEDLVGNDFVGPYTSGESYTIDKSAPVVVSSERLDPNPTNAASVNFLVTFNEPVTGVDVADFSLTTGGTISGASASGLSGTGTAYTVSVNTGSGSGSLRLDVADDDSIVDAAGNPLGGTGAGNGSYTNGEAYEVRFIYIYLPIVVLIRP